MSNSATGLDELDHRLIELLRSNARLPVAKLAAQLGVSRATVTARMERLEQSGVIAGYTIVVPTHGRHDAVRAIAMLSIDGRHSEQIVRRLAGFPEIRNLHTTNGRWDLIAEVETATLGAFDELLRKIRQIDGIASSETNILLSARKELG